MNSENSTENPARLPLAERAWQGLLLQEPLLSLEDVAELEHPDDPASQAKLRAALETDIRFLSNLACLDMADDGWLPGTWMIDREAYREWRTTCPLKLLPGSSRRIDLWLGATPSAETILPAETSLHEPVAQGGAVRPATRQIALVDTENAALLILRSELKREPGFEEFWDYLTTRDDTGTVADSTDDALMWIGKDGRNCTTSIGSMRNRLTKARKRNPFTPS